MSDVFGVLHKDICDSLPIVLAIADWTWVIDENGEWLFVHIIINNVWIIFNLKIFFDIKSEQYCCFIRGSYRREIF